MTRNKIDLAGVWDILFKVGLALLPLWVAWSVWVTTNIFKVNAFMSSGERFTQVDGRGLERRTEERFSALESKMAVQTEILRRIEEFVKRESAANKTR